MCETTEAVLRARRAVYSGPDTPNPAHFDRFFQWPFHGLSNLSQFSVAKNWPVSVHIPPAEGDRPHGENAANKDAATEGTATDVVHPYDRSKLASIRRMLRPNALDGSAVDDPDAVPRKAEDIVMEVRFPTQGFFKPEPEAEGRVAASAAVPSANRQGGALRNDWNRSYVAIHHAAPGPSRDEAMAKWIRDFTLAAVPLATYLSMNVFSLAEDRTSVLHMNGITFEIPLLHGDVNDLLQEDTVGKNKLAQREFLGRQTILACRGGGKAGIITPYTILIETLGCAVLAFPTVPCESPALDDLDTVTASLSTLSYGWQGSQSRGGAVITNHDREASYIMQVLAASLRLRGQWINVAGNGSVMGPATANGGEVTEGRSGGVSSAYLHCGLDTAVHRSRLDNRLYLVRGGVSVTPSTSAFLAAPNGPSNAYFYQRFRPEFLALHLADSDGDATTSLAPDAGAPFRAYDPQEHAEFDSAVALLHTYVIPQAAGQFTRDVNRLPRDMFSRLVAEGGLSHFLHSWGINMRFLIQFRAALHARGGYLADLAAMTVEIELCVRAVKHLVLKQRGPSGLVVDRAQAEAAVQPFLRYLDQGTIDGILMPAIADKYRAPAGAPPPNGAVATESSLLVPPLQIRLLRNSMFPIRLCQHLGMKLSRNGVPIKPDSLRCAAPPTEATSDDAPSAALPALPTVSVTFVPRVKCPPVPPAPYLEGERSQCTNTATYFLRQVMQEGPKSLSRHRDTILRYLSFVKELPNCEAAFPELPTLLDQLSDRRRERAYITLVAARGGDALQSPVGNLSMVTFGAPGTTMSHSSSSARLAATSIKYHVIGDSVPKLFSLHPDDLRPFGLAHRDEFLPSTGVLRGVLLSVIGVLDGQLWAERKQSAQSGAEELPMTYSLNDLVAHHGAVLAADASHRPGAGGGGALRSLALRTSKIDARRTRAAMTLRRSFLYATESGLTMFEISPEVLFASYRYNHGDRVLFRRSSLPGMPQVGATAIILGMAAGRLWYLEDTADLVAFPRPFPPFPDFEALTSAFGLTALQRERAVPALEAGIGITSEALGAWGTLSCGYRAVAQFGVLPRHTYVSRAVPDSSEPSSSQPDGAAAPRIGSRVSIVGVTAEGSLLGYWHASTQGGGGHGGAAFFAPIGSSLASVGRCLAHPAVGVHAANALAAFGDMHVASPTVRVSAWGDDAVTLRSGFSAVAPLGLGIRQKVFISQGRLAGQCGWVLGYRRNSLWIAVRLNKSLRSSDVEWTAIPVPHAHGRLRPMSASVFATSDHDGASLDSLPVRLERPTEATTGVAFSFLSYFGEVLTFDADPKATEPFGFFHGQLLACRDVMPPGSVVMVIGTFNDELWYAAQGEMFARPFTGVNGSALQRRHAPKVVGVGVANEFRDILHASHEPQGVLPCPPCDRHAVAEPTLPEKVQIFHVRNGGRQVAIGSDELPTTVGLDVSIGAIRNHLPLVTGKDSLHNDAAPVRVVLVDGIETQLDPSSHAPSHRAVGATGTIAGVDVHEGTVWVQWDLEATCDVDILPPSLYNRLSRLTAVPLVDARGRLRPPPSAAPPPLLRYFEPPLESGNARTWSAIRPVRDSKGTPLVGQVDVTPLTQEGQAAAAAIERLPVAERAAAFRVLSTGETVTAASFTDLKGDQHAMVSDRVCTLDHWVRHHLGFSLRVLAPSAQRGFNQALQAEAQVNKARIFHIGQVGFVDLTAAAECNRDEAFFFMPIDDADRLFAPHSHALRTAAWLELSDSGRRIDPSRLNNFLLRMSDRGTGPEGTITATLESCFECIGLNTCMSYATSVEDAVRVAIACEDVLGRPWDMDVVLACLASGKGLSRGGVRVSRPIVFSRPYLYTRFDATILHLHAAHSEQPDRIDPGIGRSPWPTWLKRGTLVQYTRGDVTGVTAVILGYSDDGALWRRERPEPDGLNVHGVTPRALRVSRNDAEWFLSLYGAVRLGVVDQGDVPTADDFTWLLQDGTVAAFDVTVESCRRFGAVAGERYAATDASRAGYPWKHLVLVIVGVRSDQLWGCVDLTGAIPLVAADGVCFADWHLRRLYFAPLHHPDKLERRLVKFPGYQPVAEAEWTSDAERSAPMIFSTEPFAAALLLPAHRAGGGALRPFQLVQAITSPNPNDKGKKFLYVGSRRGVPWLVREGESAAREFPHATSDFFVRPTVGDWNVNLQRTALTLDQPGRAAGLSLPSPPTLSSSLRFLAEGGWVGIADAGPEQLQHKFGLEHGAVIMYSGTAPRLPAKSRKAESSSRQQRKMAVVIGVRDGVVWRLDLGTPIDKKTGGEETTQRDVAAAYQRLAGSSHARPFVGCADRLTLDAAFCVEEVSSLPREVILVADLRLRGL